MSWTDERVERLKALRHLGFSASQIAKDLGGVSRNAVCGKAHRLKLAPLPRAVVETTQKATTSRRRIARPNNLIAINAERRRLKRDMDHQPFEPIPGSNPKPWLERGFGQCSWIVSGEGADALSCCEPVKKRWCATHDAIGHAVTNAKPAKTAKASDIYRPTGDFDRWAAA